MAILVREAEVADAGAIATSHVRSWQAGYADVISGELAAGSRLRTSPSALCGGRRSSSAPRRRAASCSSSSSTVRWRVGWVAGLPRRGHRMSRTRRGDTPATSIPHTGAKVSGARSWRRRSSGSPKPGTTAVLWVLADNVGARAFYEHHGWLRRRSSKMYEWAASATPRCVTAASLPRKQLQPQSERCQARRSRRRPRLPGGRPAPKPGGMPPAEPGNPPPMSWSPMSRSPSPVHAGPSVP